MTLWPRVPLRRVATVGTGHTPSRQHPEYWDDCSIPWLTLADVWQFRDESRTHITETAEKISSLGLANSAAAVHPQGTVAMSRTASVGYSCVLGRDMATSQDFVVWRCGPLLDAEFLLYALRGLRDEILGLRMGSTHQTIYMPDIERITIPLPPLTEQRAIVELLRTETTRCDALIARRIETASLHEERRMSVMHAGVRGALTNDGPRSEARIPWIDDLPKSWNEVRLTRVAQLGSGHTPSRSRPEWWVPDECVIPWVTTGEVAQMRSDRIEYLTQTRERISQAGLENSSAALNPVGTVVLCRTAASAGYSAIMGEAMATSQDFATWRCGHLLRPRFLLLCLRAMRADLLGRLAIGSTHKTIYMPEIETIRIPLPALAEQDRIVAAVDRELVRSDRIIEAFEREVALLRERRAAYVSAAVTGAVDTATAA